MNLEELQRNWDALGANDPWWAVLSHRDKRHCSWDIGEFFATGRQLVDDTMAWVRAACPGLATDHALDFGCGAGRLSHALADHFDRVTGVDIAPSMIEVARTACADRPGCEFLLNDRPDLTALPDQSVDFVCSYIVLQHMEPRFAEGYLREFGRLLRPGGALVVQVPSEPVPTWKGRLRRVLATPSLQPLLNAYKRLRYQQSCAMEMYGIRRQRVAAVLRAVGLEPVAVTECTSAGPNWISYRYLAVKAPVTVAAG